MKYARIFRAMCSMPWMVQPEKLEAFFEMVTLRIEGGNLTPEEVAGRTAHPRKGESREPIFYAIDAATVVASGRSSDQSQKNVAVLPIYGVIMHRPTMELSSGGGFNIQEFRANLKSVLDNPNVSAVVLDIDSPGGTVDGVEELSKEIYQARHQKKIVAIANTLAASAAYYLASAASELYVSPSGEVGSIGVYMLHQDASAFYDQKGIKNTLIKAGKYKAEGNPWMPLGEESLAALQKNVDAHYDMFTRAVARNRGVSVDSVRNGFGEGRTVIAKEAVKLGMADKVATLSEVLHELGVRKEKRDKNISVEAEQPEVAAVSEEAGFDAEQRQRQLDMF
jgi:capsid assembly protease